MKSPKGLSATKPIHDFGPLQFRLANRQQTIERRPWPVAKIRDKAVLLWVEVDVKQ